MIDHRKHHMKNTDENLIILLFQLAFTFYSYFHKISPTINIDEQSLF